MQVPSCPFTAELGTWGACEGGGHIKLPSPIPACDGQATGGRLGPRWPVTPRHWSSQLLVTQPPGGVNVIPGATPESLKAAPSPWSPQGRWVLWVMQPNRPVTPHQHSACTRSHSVTRGLGGRAPGLAFPGRRRSHRPAGSSGKTPSDALISQHLNKPPWAPV